MKTLNVTLFALGLGACSVIATSGSAQAAKCLFMAHFSDGVYAGVDDVGRASKKKTACKRARRGCDRKLERARRKGKIAHRGAKCGRITGIVD